MVELRSGRRVENEEIPSASGARVDTSRGRTLERLEAPAPPAPPPPRIRELRNPAKVKMRSACLRKSPLTMDSHMADELVVPLKFPGDTVHFLSHLVLLVEDTMAKVEGMRGKDNSKPIFVKRGAPNIAPTFRNNNVNNNNKRPNTGRDVAGDKRVKVEGRAQNVPRRQGRLNAVLEADLSEEGGYGGRDEFRTCWGRVEDLLVAEELWNDHKKLIFFPVASAATCTDGHLEVDQRDPVNAMAR
ncbi:hypothetical protein Taro_042855 [Colocasia esculenta]|uniref:Uncharacterized protein n=1 Tax=Colocasia esculenta TaxID=4460 RepID=A0A843WJF5_COLES|nr:hypothetical protein [Colocasia esculenta]